MKIFNQMLIAIISGCLIAPLMAYILFCICKACKKQISKVDR